MPVPDALRPLVEHAPDALLVLDFDGTISTIVSHPDDAVAIEGVVDTLCELTSYLKVAFITGRPVDWLLERTAPCLDRGVEFIGLHGHERLRDGVIVANPESAKWRHHVGNIHDEAMKSAPEDVVIEMKGLGLALHFRTSPTAESWIRAFAADAAATSGLVAHDTRFAIELRPPVDLDKGHAMQELVADYRPWAMAFFGDDLVDIPAVIAMRQFPDIASAAVFISNVEGPLEYAQIADLVLPSPLDAAEALRALLESLRA
ncbi:MAG TPA: trehalose-phosphatase [Acidimicrobiales bacterium]|nr:trehalose-phosphatase [Acidimicrobiales bacterium]